MHAALAAELGLGVARDDGGELDLLAVQILAGKLRQPGELARERLVEPAVAVAEIDRGVPHLQVEVGAAGGVVEEAALAALKNFRRGIVHGVAVRAIEGLELEQLALVDGSVRLRRAAGGKLKRTAHGSIPPRQPAPRTPDRARRSSGREARSRRPGCRTQGREGRAPGSARRALLWRG